MATADVVAGTGGIDASIGFELDRDENPGKGFNETLFNLREFMTARTSMADLIAMGALFSVGGCSGGKVEIPFKGGRVDATGTGAKGVPKPEETIESHENSFKRQGFDKEEMIGLVACGHTLGGVHGVDFPEIVDVVNDTSVDDNTQTFDSTIEGESSFDNKVATDFVANVTQNPLAFGHNETTRSDARIFNSDSGSLIKKMAASNDFFLSKCNELLERMINTVPKSVTLGKTIDIATVKPSSLYATINANGTLTFSGLIRLISRQNSLDADPGRTVKLHLRPRSGGSCNKVKCVTVDAKEFSWSRSLYHDGGFPYFKKYKFSQNVTLKDGLSGFDIEVIDTAKDGSVSNKMYTNGGNGFPFDDSIVTQSSMACVSSRDTGKFNLTVAVRDDTKLSTVSARLQYPSSLTELVPSIASKKLSLSKVGTVAGAGYTLYSAKTTIPAGDYTLTYDLLASNKTYQQERLFNEVPEIASCPRKL